MNLDKHFWSLIAACVLASIAIAVNDLIFGFEDQFLRGALFGFGFGSGYWVVQFKWEK